MSRRQLDTGTDELLGEVRDGVAIFTLNRPQARNALSDRLTPALRAGIAACDSTPEIGAFLITGAGAALEARTAELIERQRRLTGERRPADFAAVGRA